MFLQKPFDDITLLQRIRALLDSEDRNGSYTQRTVSWLRRRDETLNERLLREAGYDPDGTKGAIKPPLERTSEPWSPERAVPEPGVAGWFAGRAPAAALGRVRHDRRPRAHG